AGAATDPSPSLRLRTVAPGRLDLCRNDAGGAGMITSPEREQDQDEARRHQRDRFLFLALVLLILGPSLLYVWGAGRTAREIARRGALEQNFATAQLGARLIDAQCTTALAVLRSLAERRALLDAMGRRMSKPPAEGGPAAADTQTAIRRHLRDAVELV